MRILFTGGGTMGSVTPLIAIAEYLKSKDANIDLWWIGTKKGTEKKVVQNYNIEFKAITSGKLRRYFSIQNFVDILRVIWGFVQSLIILMRVRPNSILSAGGYVAVPVVWAGWLLGIPSFIHQQDVRPGLANKLCAKAASKITICFPESVKYFPAKKTGVVGNPVRNVLKKGIINKKKLYKKFNLSSHKPVILITSGGRGARFLNDLASDAIGELTEASQVIHITGKHKSNRMISNKKSYENYHEYEFLLDMPEALMASDLVISRGGMGTLTEIAYLGKPSIIIPIPESHQVDNVKYFENKKAVVYLDQEGLEEDLFAQEIKELLDDKERMMKLGENANKIMKWGAEERIGEMINNF